MKYLHNDNEAKRIRCIIRGKKNPLLNAYLTLLRRWW